MSTTEKPTTTATNHISAAHPPPRTHALSFPKDFHLGHTGLVPCVCFLLIHLALGGGEGRGGGGPSAMLPSSFFLLGTDQINPRRDVSLFIVCWLVGSAKNIFLACDPMADQIRGCRTCWRRTTRWVLPASAGSARSRYNGFDIIFGPTAHIAETRFHQHRCQGFFLRSILFK